ncbi:MAG: ABC transporter permease [Gemmatimonadetes bacterium]|nr:ABC transporter permease [Gemmatimonadota bacterium]
MLDTLRRDFSHAVRSLRRTPAFTITAALILGLGIGMASAMFTVFQAVLLKRLPVQDQDQIIELSGVGAGAAREVPLSLDQYTQFQQQNRTLQSVAGFAHWGAAPSAVMDGERLFSLRHAVVTGNFFEVLGAAPYLGRLFVPTDQTEYGPVNTSPDVLSTVISYDTWRRQFGGDPRIFGRRLRLPEVKWNPTIVGVAPPGLDYPRGVEIWTPNAYPGGMDLVARLAAGATAAAARADYAAFVKNDPTFIKMGVASQIGARSAPLEQMVVGDVKPALVTLTAAVGMLLLLGCVNVGNLLLLRAAGRARERAVRRALGAGTSNIVKQLATESALLALGGGLLGLGMSKLVLALLIRFAPEGLPRLDMIRLAPAPLVVTAGLTLFAVVFLGLLPALLSTRFDLSSQLRADARSGTEGRRLRRVRRALVVSQMALALVLLAGAGLLMRSFGRLSGLDLGFPTEHVSVVGVSMPWEGWVVQCGGMPPQSDSVGNKRLSDCVDARIYQFHDQLAQAFDALPGVEKASSVAGQPFLGSNVFMTKLVAEGQSDAEASTNPWVGFDFVGPEYFAALGLPILRGRALMAADREGSAYVAVVSQGIAKQLWPGEDPIGKRVRMGGPDQPEVTVVGLVGDIHFREHRRSTPMIIRPFRQRGLAQGTLVMRTGPTVPSFSAIRNAVHVVDPHAVLVKSRSMDELRAPQIAQPRLNAWLLSAFAFVAVLLAAIGLYGIMASAVSQQTREFGVRMALGAAPERLRQMVLGQALTVAGAGAAMGLIGALAGSRLLTSMLFEISPTDPVTLIGVSVLLLAVALLAAYLPARRATKIDPAQALRAE